MNKHLYVPGPQRSVSILPVQRLHPDSWGILLHFDVAVETWCFLLKFCWWVSRTFSPVFRGPSSLSLNLSSGEPAVTGLDFSLKGGLLFMFSSTKFEKAHKWLWRWVFCTLTSAPICRTACVFLICVFLWQGLLLVFLGHVILLVSYCSQSHPCLGPQWLPNVL